MFQSRMFITTATRFLILIGIIVSVHGKAQNQNGYRPIFVNFNNQVDVFEGGPIGSCLTTITARTYDGTVANENIRLHLKDDIDPYFGINDNSCLKIKPGMTISKTNDNPTLPVVVIATDTRYPQFSNEITININFTSSDMNVNRKLIKIQSSHWFDNEHDDDDDDDNDDKKNVIGIPETIEPSEPIMTITKMTENVVNFTSLNDKYGIFRFENNQVYANEDKLNFTNGNGIGMRDFDLIIVATNDQHQYQYRKIKIKTLRSRGSPPRLQVHKTTLSIDEETPINAGCICQLYANDPEPEIGSTIYFEIIKPTNYFSIDESGCIELKERLDRECMMSDQNNCRPSHLKVSAFFEGRFLETVVSIKVNITDINDHAPKLKMNNATVYERKKSKIIAKLTAIDKDSDEKKNNSFKFEINNDSHYPDGKKFEIKNNNELYNIVPLHVNSENKKYEISITIRDNENPRKSNTSIFTVEVKKKNGLKFIQSKYVVFISENGEIDTPVTKYFWVKNNSGPVDYKIVQTDSENYFSVAKTYDSDMDIYYGQIVVNKNFNYRGKISYVDLDIKASDKFSSDILTVRVYYINANKPAIKLNPLGNSYSELKQIAKDSVECIAMVHASGSSITDNPIQYNISEASSERYLGSSTYSEEVVKSLFVKIDKDNGCIQIQKYNGLHQNELMVVRAYYKHDDSPKPLISRRLIRIRLVNSMEPLISEHFMKIRPVNLNNQMYNVTVTDAM